MARFRWGFQWGKVGSGGLMLLVGGGISGLALLGGRILLWPIGLAFVGLIVMLTGLMGEDGVW